jgi:pyrroloquinoline quinone (PQQ) biosynthesis protein C
MDLRRIQNDVTDRLMSTRIVQALKRGEMTRAQYRTYMQDVYCYAMHSSQVIGLAGCRLVLSHPTLSQYLLHHATEELGHDKWAALDLKDLGLSDDEISAITPSAPCLRMIGLEYYYAVHANPVGLFGWMFVLESLGGRVGGSISQAIDQSLGLQGKGVYFLRGHGEADAHHSEDLFTVITEGVTHSQDRDDFLRMIRESEDLYRGILDNTYAIESRKAEAMLV